MIKGFTLAEVLITLGIIGVVAAMTLPALINRVTYKEMETGLQKNYSLIQQASEKGYKYIAISDHNTFNGYLENNVPDYVIPAVEFDVWCGYVFMHLLGYGIDVNNKELQQFCAKSKRETELDIIRIFSTRNIKKLIQAIHNAGGLAVLAHPACCWALSHDRFIKKLISYGLDGLEVYYPYKRHRGIIKFTTARNIEKIADKYGLIKTGGTDLHDYNL